MHVLIVLIWILISALACGLVIELSRGSLTAKRRQVAFIDYQLADKLLKLNLGWRLAPEEDDNKIPGMVWIERDV